jgi:hypothetical protein
LKFGFGDKDGRKRLNELGYFLKKVSKTETTNYTSGNYTPAVNGTNLSKFMLKICNYRVYTENS